MNNDQLQVLALALEISGLGLAFLHAFKQDISARIDRLIHAALLALGARKMDYAMPGVDYDDELKDEEKGPASTGYFVFIMFTGFIIVHLSLLFDFGNGFLSTLFEIALASLLGPVVSVMLHSVISAALNFLACILLRTGNGDYAVSFGFILATLGLSIEMKQVYESSLAWVLLAFPIALTCIVVRVAITKRRQ